MKTPYTFSVVRYIHDVVSGEFINVGIVLYAPELNYLDSICTKKYGRLSRVFINVDGDQFRSLMRFLESQLSFYMNKLDSELLFDGKPKSILGILSAIIPQDDSSLQFSKEGFGLTNDPRITLEELYNRYVDQYTDRSKRISRDDDEVWKSFKRPLEERSIIKYLKPHRIVAHDFEYEFQHSWKNDQWRFLEPISLDLEDPSSITDKANKWLGRSISLSDSSENFKLYMLLGKPHEERLQPAFIKAENILNKITIPKEFIREDESEGFAEHLKFEIQRHHSEE
jgi:hypothetical protein